MHRLLPHNAFLSIYKTAYRRALRPLLFRRYSAQEAHEKALETLRWLDDRPLLHPGLSGIRKLTLPDYPVTVGGVDLNTPLIAAAGLIKGDGFPDEDVAYQAVQNKHNIIPGWQTMPRLVGPVEFGSVTRWPRLGNLGTVIWRDVAAQSTQNRVGLRNPGAKAVAAFLAQRPLSHQMGINVAVSPGVSDRAQEEQEICETVDILLAAGLHPAWITLNLSCPNTEDDPGGNQSETKVYQLCGAILELLTPHNIPLWVKLGPDLAEVQYTRLMAAFADVGVAAVVATNTLGLPTPDRSGHIAGIGGLRLHDAAVSVVELLAQQREIHSYPVDIIGCGGVMDGATLHDFVVAGADAVQYWSAMVYEGPLAAAVILQDFCKVRGV
jgi:dihydroorotate dehydrogenase